jgi:hypothetical protein
MRRDDWAQEFGSRSAAVAVAQLRVDFALGRVSEFRENRCCAAAPDWDCPCDYNAADDALDRARGLLGNAQRVGRIEFRGATSG